MKTSYQLDDLNAVRQKSKQMISQIEKKQVSLEEAKVVAYQCSNIIKTIIVEIKLNNKANG